jgi:hypothetical protein
VSQYHCQAYTTWTMKEICEWFHVGGLSSKGEKTDLMNALYYIMSLENAPQLLPPKGGHASDDLQLTQALAVAIGYKMQLKQQ